MMYQVCAMKEINLVPLNVSFCQLLRNLILISKIIFSFFFYSGKSLDLLSNVVLSPNNSLTIVFENYEIELEFQLDFVTNSTRRWVGVGFNAAEDEKKQGRYVFHSQMHTRDQGDCVRLIPSQNLFIAVCIQSV